jgi:peptidylprolyl isomerase
MFDSSVARKRPASFGVKGVIAGWTEALQLMVVGEKRRLWIPGKLAYGDRPRMGAPAGPLTFDVELLEVVEAPKPPEVPKDVAAPPATAKKTKSGLVYRILSKGPGAVNPKATDRVRVHYTGWSKDGKMFDSSVMRGQPTTFGLNQVIKGWTEGVQLMKVGDKARFWIPGNLAYGDKPKRPGAPSGQLTFDIELLQIL